MILKFIFQRLLFLIFILLSVSILVFISIRLIPGDPAQIMLGERATHEALEKLREQLGLNQPIYIQYFIYLKNLLSGDLGTSIVTNNKILSEILRKFPATIELAFASMFISVIIGVLSGILAALYRNSWIDNIVMTFALTGVSMPIFWLGLILMLIFSSYLNLLPFSGRIDIATEIVPITNFYLIDTLLQNDINAFFDAINHLILPALTLSSIPTAIIARMTRASMLNVLNKDYIKTAYAKGLSKFKVIIKHAFRNALMPIITISGLQLGSLLSGAVLTETIFAWNGLGSYVVNAVLSRDFPVIQGCVLIFSATFVIVNTLVDLSYFFIDPRIRTKL
ncbi:MAG: peptide ABC transporter permease [Candidatus Sericytochromatia bacterium]|nr:MAG: peptide ABC transporter permease [Candidatus Sericytochromatia bacterium]